MRWILCESSAFIERRGQQELLLEDVIQVKPIGDKLLLTALLGRQVEVRAEIIEIDLAGHRILLRERG